MGLRFSKSIKICDGLKMNISKSGVSFSAGVKGAKVNTGKNGTYLNLSLPGTGVSYRQKLTSLGVGTVINAITGKKTGSSVSKTSNKKAVKTLSENEIKNNEETYQNYLETVQAQTRLYMHCDNVLSKNAFDNQLQVASDKENFVKLISGDEEAVETAVGQFLSELSLSYEVNTNYELEDNILYVDVDLPEIENFSDKTYELDEQGNLSEGKLNKTQLRQYYSEVVTSLAIFLSANFFNISSYIDKIIMSAYTKRRNTTGDLIDDYIYSIKFDREVFENTELKTIDSAYNFILKFDNRINLSSTYIFKSIKPYELASVEPIVEESQPATKILNQQIVNTIVALKTLGYKDCEIRNIEAKLEEQDFASVNEYLKFALQLLAK